MNDFNYDNEIIEIDSDKPIETPVESKTFSEPIVEEKYKKRRKSLKDRWNDIPKKKRTIIIVVTSIILIVAILLVLYFTIFKKEEVPEEPKEVVILEKDNYVYKDGNLFFLNKSDKEIGSYECVNKDPDKCAVMKVDYSNDEFERVLSVYESGDEVGKTSQIYNDNFVFITDGKDSYLYNIKEKKKELKVNKIKIYGTEKNLVVIEDEDGKYGLIEIATEEFNYLIRPSYDNLGIVNTKLAYLVALDKEKTYIINSEGKKLSENITGTIKSANKDYIVVVKNKTYNLYNYEYEELLSDYDYISLNDEVIGLVKSNRLYLRDNELNKLNEDGFRLSNSDYVKKYIYDSENKLKETKKAYEIVVKDNYAMITIGEDTKNVNMYEGKISSKYDYLSYFDGKLYFYNDSEKEDLIGTYTCNNKNNITSNSDSFTSCTLYNNSGAISGIYNSDIVFIYDNSTTDIKYYVYSLKEKKTKGTYSYIEFANNTELKENVDHIGTSEPSYIICVTDTGNNKGNYGVIEINSSKVSGKVKFDYKAIKKEGNYYIMTDKDNLYTLYNIAFSKISNTFDYIKLYDRYYVGIIKNKLNVYNYFGSNKMLKEDLTVSDNKYEISFENGILITIDDKTYNYDVNGNLIVNNIENTNNTENIESTNNDGGTQDEG